MKLGKKNAKVVLNMNAFRILSQKFGVKLAAIDTYMQEEGVEAVCAITYSGILNAAARQNKETDISYDQFCALFLEDNTGMEKVSELINEVFGPAEESGNE